ncbi:uncharacterized protein [Polyergus mexicanus]|uniref:uncharacterized protein n=1 Tax=Polyergus mexicanus TaxID=615972 RepID=UPI0038B676BE
MFDNVSKCVNGGGSRLIKAKSSPNVSKTALSFARKQNQSNQTTTSPMIAPNKSSRLAKPPTTSRISIKTPNDAVNPSRRASINSDSSKSRLVVSSKPLKRSPNEARPDATKTVPSAARNDKRKICESVSSSSTCTILEDRALLKKGLTNTPEKRPAKPEALRQKSLLDRSVSLSSVSSDNQTSPTAINPRWISIFSARRSTENEKKTESSRKGLTLINRSTSLWSVRTPRADNSQCGKSFGAPARLNSVSRPSKIPLPATRSTGLGRSLADLSQVDRAEETVCQTTISFELDLDASSNERIYENCRETLDRASTKFNSPRSTSMSNLEERAARLMAQLENDLEPKETIVPVDVVDVAPPCRTETVYEDRETPRKNNINIEKKCDFFENDKNHEILRADEKAKREKTIISKDINVKSEKDLQKEESVIKEFTFNRIKICEKPDEFTKELKINKENLNSIQELKRNWENQIGGIANQNTGAQTIHAANCGRMTVDLSKAARIGNDIVDDAQETKRRRCIVGQRAKDIEHLVNFFNCKNIEAAKEPPREVLIKSRSVDVSIIDTPALKKNESKSGNEYSGYTSDGNCSEDSGHMSNENEVEWKETMENQSQKEINEFKGQQYFDRIDRDDDSNDVKIFEPKIIRRLAEPEKKKDVINRNSLLMSSNASGTDNCRDDRCSENGRQVRV